MTHLVRAVPVPAPTPVAAAVRGAVGGVAATLLLSVLARVLPGMRDRLPGWPAPPVAPSDPFDPAGVQAWQARAQTPALSRGHAHGPPREHRSPPGSPPGSPGVALVQVQAPGPEGLAAQFAFKFALGVFDKDIAGQLGAVGFGVHVLYGSFWGVLFGIAQGTYHRRSSRVGALYGLLVWLLGPALLVPAMKLMRSPAAEPPGRTAAMVTGHVAYGLALAAVYERLEGSDRRRDGEAGSR